MTSSASSSNLEPRSKCVRLSVSTRFEPILPLEILSDRVPLIDFYVVTVVDKKRISSLLSILCSRAPLLDTHAHLKRVNKDGVILINPTADGPPGAKLLEELGFSQKDICIRSVPSIAAYSKRQYVWAKCHWPTNFRLDKELEQMLGDSYFTENEKLAFVEHLQRARDLSVDRGATVGCVVANARGQLVAEGSDSIKRRKDRPLAHAVMVALEMVALSQQGGSDFLSQQEQSHFRLNRDANTGRQYLCTDYDCFLTDEPCVMCAMALLHSRIARVFYLNDSASSGALGSRMLLHCRKALNHRFKVFRVHLS